MPVTLEPIPGINLTYEDADILLTWQKLWIDYVQWMRNHLLSVLENLPGQNATETELYLNQPAAIHDELRKYFDDEMAHQYLNVVSKFTAGNWNLTNAYKYKDKTAIDIAISQWYQTADELATFYAKYFQNIDISHWKQLVYEYLNLKIQQINALANGNYDLEVDLYNQIEDRAIEIGNHIATSIIVMQHQKNEAPAPQKECIRKY